MILITDSNIVYSALINPNSVTAKVFKDKANLQFFAPDYLFEEVKKHWDKIVLASSLTEKELKEELMYYKKRILIYGKKIEQKHLEKAEKILSNIDTDDVFFVALHFQIKHKIWTGDKALIKGLKAKGYDICVTTAELKQKLYKK